MRSLFTIISILYSLLIQAGGTFTLLEINPLHSHSQLTPVSDSAKTVYGAGEMTGFTEMGGKLYFSAQGTQGDEELWVTDGTVAGTTLVKAINPGHGAALGNLVYMNSHILFMATDNGTDWDLWSTDGTDSGTVKINELDASTNKALSPNNMSVLGNRLIFCANQKLLSTDGTAIGTDSILSIANYGTGAGYCEVNHNVYFVLPEITGDYEIWRTDGTVAGTQAVLGMNNIFFNTTVTNQMVSFNDQIYLLATDSGQSPALYTYDGTVNGLLNHLSIPSSGTAIPQGLKLYDSALYFIANDSLSSNIYRISTASSVPAALIPNSTISVLSNLSFANNSVYGMEPGNKHIHAVELSGFTHSLLNLSGYTLPTYPDVQKEFMLGMANQIFFEAYDSTSATQVLLQSDFTNAGTQALVPAGANTMHPFNSRSGGGMITDIFDLRMWGNKIVMPANYTDAGRELWILDPGIVNGVENISEAQSFIIFPNPSNNEVTLKTTPCSNCEQKAGIINTSGEIVAQQTLQEGSVTINLSSFATGNYFISLSQNGNMFSTKKIVLIK